MHQTQLISITNSVRYTGLNLTNKGLKMNNRSKLTIDLDDSTLVALNSGSTEKELELEVLGTDQASEASIRKALSQVRRIKRALADAEDILILKANKKFLEKNLSLF